MEGSGPLGPDPSSDAEIFPYSLLRHIRHGGQYSLTNIRLPADGAERLPRGPEIRKRR